MHRDISLEAYLDEKFSDRIIETVLQRALQLNIRMYAYTDDMLFTAPPITIEEALRRIDNKEDNASVLCGFEDTGFFLHFIELESGKCEIGLGATNFSWKKEFWRGVEKIEFDLPRYIRLLLMVVQGFKINKIEAYVHWV